MNNTLPALSVANVAVRQHDGLYSLNDLHKASGGATKHQPYEFVRLDQTQALIAELSKSGDSRNYIQTKRGKHNGGTFACRELVIAYAAWISAAFHLKVIRVFLDSVAAQRRIDETHPLTPAHALCIIIPARANSRAGCGSPNQWRNSAHRPMTGAFSLPAHRRWVVARRNPLNGGRRGEPQGSPVHWQVFHTRVVRHLSCGSEVADSINPVEFNHE